MPKLLALTRILHKSGLGFLS